jgi:predicted restriction endonuclease
VTAILKSTKSPAPNSRTDIEERLRRRAYEIYEHRCRIDGLELGDWFQAETEIINQRRKRKAVIGAACS